jgi:sodium-dependent dicarboxylate transporter 2/3/5
MKTDFVHQSAVVAKRNAIWWGPLLGVVVALMMSKAGWAKEACFAGGVAVWTASWWIFEPIPIPATSLIPLGTFPLLGVLSGNQIALAYGDPLILFLLGGAILSKAMEKSGAHRRLALGMVRVIGGGSSRRVVFGFMAAAGLLSMWLSNTATTFMLLPVMVAVLEKAEDPKLAIPLLLGVAYAASIGGMGTPMGTTPNLIFMRVYEETTGGVTTFSEWMSWGVPVVVLLIPLTALWLTRNLKSGGKIDVPELGRWTAAEVRVLTIFVIAALAWVTLNEPFGGWAGWFKLPYADLASVSFIACVVLFVCPDGKGGKLLDWETAVSVHWGVFLLFAGGIAIASALTQTGISAALGRSLGGLSSVHPFVIILAVCFGVTFLTEITSNTATATMLMPILAAAGVGAGVDPKLLMIPAALSASCAFMLPVATAPNAIVFSADRMTVQDMAREGFGLNIVAALAIAITIYVVVS